MAIRLSVLLCALSACACGLYLHGAPTEWQQEEARRPTSRTVEGEVRDTVTMALVRDTSIEASTDIGGYAPGVTVDGGRFHLFVDTLRRRASSADQVMGQAMLGDLYSGDVKVSVVRYRARAGTRCSPIERVNMPYQARNPVILWVRECDPRELARSP